jgi:hypothetical protein
MNKEAIAEEARKFAKAIGQIEPTSGGLIAGMIFGSSVILASAARQFELKEVIESLLVHMAHEPDFLWPDDQEAVIDLICLIRAGFEHRKVARPCAKQHS